MICITCISWRPITLNRQCVKSTRMLGMGSGLSVLSLFANICSPSGSRKWLLAPLHWSCHKAPTQIHQCHTKVPMATTIFRPFYLFVFHPFYYICPIMYVLSSLHACLFFIILSCVYSLASGHEAAILIDHFEILFCVSGNACI
jgi:hypothetical protein